MVKSAVVATLLETTAAAKATAKASTHAEASTGAKVVEAAAAAEAATTAEAHTTASITVFTDLNHATLPIIAVKLLNGVARIIGALEDNDTRALGAAIGAGLDIGTEDVSVLGYWFSKLVAAWISSVAYSLLTGLTEQVLQILPANRVGEL